MSDKTNIEWTAKTGGPWLGCTEVSPGCANCYARELATSRLEHIFRRAYKSAGFEDWETRPVWGKTAPRVLSKGFWNDAPAWNRAAAKKGEHWTIFPSMIDWLDEMPAGIIDQDGKWLDKDEVLARFLSVIYDTPNLTWQLLTKRPENWLDRICAVFEFTGKDHASYEKFQSAHTLCNEWLNESATQRPPGNIWIGASVEDQPRADQRITKLLEIPAKVRFLSAEPLLGPIDFANVSGRADVVEAWGQKALTGIQWVIIGGESGPGARPCKIEWIRDLVRQCRDAGVTPFVKQLGAQPMDAPDRYIHLADKKGGDMSEWPADLHVREFPK